MNGKPVYKRWSELKPRNATGRQWPTWVRFPRYMAPLCGWPWLERTQHIVPVYRAELTLAGVRYTFSIKSGGILKEVMKANKIKKVRKSKVRR